MNRSILDVAVLILSIFSAPRSLPVDPLEAQNQAIPHAERESAQPIAAQVDAYLKPYADMQDFSGAVLIARGSRVLVNKAYGMANCELAVTNTPQTRFRIASVSKQFTAAAVLLQEQRKLLSTPSSRAPSRRPSPLRTVRETFASHGSSTQERPSEKQGRRLIQVQMRPTRYGLAANSHGNGYNPPDVCEAAPTACAVVICIASFIGSANVLEFEYHREVGSVSGEVMWSHKGNATSICPITGQHSLFLSSAIRITIDPPCGFTSPKGSDTDLPCSAERT